ncbi:MAG TPA: GMC family oxidoreductase N-terminal domain-containing protein [Candidatus Limnocylindria bacterium]
MADRMSTLAALCDTFVPGDATLPSASALGVPQLIRSELDALGRPSLVSELDLLLRLVENPLASLALVGRPVRFSSLSQEERERYVKALGASALPLKRVAFQDVKRLALLYTYAVDRSPYWDVVGYQPAPLDPPSPSPVRARAPNAGETIEADVCVIGSGAGGGVAAGVLAAAGKHVVVLEKAPLVTEEGFDGRELAGLQRLFVDRGLAATSDRAISVRAGSAVGGGTIVNWNTSLRAPDEVLEEWRRAGIDDLDPHYEAVIGAIDIDADESPRNGPNAMLERGLDALGLKHETIQRNTKGCGDCGPCAVGCRRGAKQSTLRTYLADASRHGAEILHGCEATRIVTRDGRVESVIAQVVGGEITVRAPLVALAGGSILSPALLLRSGIAADVAGRNLFLHPVSVVAGAYDDRLEAWSGVPQSVMSDHFANISGDHGFRIECAPAHPGVLASGFPWWGSAEYVRKIRDSANVAPFLAIVRDLTPGRVELDRDGKTRMRYFPAEMERRLLVRGMVELAKIHHAAGARRLVTLYTPPLELEGRDGLDRFTAEIERRGIAPNRVVLFSAHQMGTCRIGTSPRDSVADPNGQVWGVRGLFVTDASAFPSASGVNPMLSIMAIARRTATRMAAA